MGIGDEIMASGHARSVHYLTGKRVRIVDYHGRPRWDPIWQGLDWIARRHERGDFATIQNGAQCRPYIEYPFTRLRGQRFTAWRARDHVGAIALTASERNFAEDFARAFGTFVIVEPNIAAKSNPNKQWGAHNWQTLADAIGDEGLTVVQFATGPHRLRGVREVRAPDFRHGAAVLARAAAAVLPEGGLHHAAGVLGVPAVVLFGGTISPETTGYANHINLADDGDGSPCGRWRRCRHCRGIWAALAPADVMRSLLHILKEDRPCPASLSRNPLPGTPSAACASPIRRVPSTS